MSERQFAKLFDLVALDQEILACEKQLDQITEVVAFTFQQKEKVLRQEQELKHKAHEIRFYVDTLELGMRVLDEQESKKKIQIDAVHSLKEYNSIKAELDTIHQQQQHKEQELLAAWNRLENTQHELQEYQERLEGRILETEQKVQDSELQAHALKERIIHLIAQRTSHEQDIPQEWLQNYTAMRARVADPVVPISDTACSACFNNITAQDLLRIKRGGLIPCKGCYRLLYLQKS